MLQLARAIFGTRTALPAASRLAMTSLDMGWSLRCAMIRERASNLTLRRQRVAHVEVPRASPAVVSIDMASVFIVIAITQCAFAAAVLCSALIARGCGMRIDRVALGF